jgi:hypothetical protein
MKKISAVVVGIFLSALLIAPVNAAPSSGPGNQQASQGGNQVQIKPTSKAAKSWNDREKKRYAAKKRAEAMRQKQLSKNSRN